MPPSTIVFSHPPFLIKIFFVPPAAKQAKELENYSLPDPFSFLPSTSNVKPEIEFFLLFARGAAQQLKNVLI